MAGGGSLRRGSRARRGKLTNHRRRRAFLLGGTGRPAAWKGRTRCSTGKSEGAMEETAASRGGASLSAWEREELLRIARVATIACITGGRIPSEPPVHPELSEPGTAFVTLRSGGRLRGCIGYTEPHTPLFRTVRECAVAAATAHSRTVRNSGVWGSVYPMQPRRRPPLRSVTNAVPGSESSG